MPDGSSIPIDAITSISSIRERIDPDGTLPSVDLVVSPDNPPLKGTLRSTKYQIVHEGEVVGDATIQMNDSTKESSLYPIDIPGENQKRGYGLATYVRVIEMAQDEGFVFRTHDWSQTEGSKRIWEILEEHGVAIVKEPFVAAGEDRFTGHYYVPVAQPFHS